MSKCDFTLIEKVRPLRERNLDWKVIAQVVGVHVSTLHAWKNPDDPNYDERFAVMVVEARDEFDTGKIKAGQVKQAQKHKLRKVTMERKVTKCPVMPPSHFNKADIIKYADEELDLVLSPRLTIDEMRTAMFRYIPELIEYGEPYYVVEDVIVKIEESEVDPTQPAVKNVLSNMGKKEKRWNFKEDIGIEPSTELNNFMDWLAGRDNAKG